MSDAIEPSDLPKDAKSVQRDTSTDFTAGLTPTVLEPEWLANMSDEEVADWRAQHGVPGAETNSESTPIVERDTVFLFRMPNNEYFCVTGASESFEKEYGRGNAPVIRPSEETDSWKVFRGTGENMKEVMRHPSNDSLNRIATYRGGYGEITVFTNEGNLLVNGLPENPDGNGVWYERKIFGEDTGFKDPVLLVRLDENSFSIEHSASSVRIGTSTPERRPLPWATRGLVPPR